MNKDNLQIYVVINHKFKNNLIPNLPNLVISYLLENKEKISYYLNNYININDILKRISSLNNEINILSEVINYVENNNV